MKPKLLNGGESLEEKIEYLSQHFNEVAFGWDDCMCIWRMQYGPRGAGGMLSGFGKVIYADDDAETFGEAVDSFIAQIDGKE